MKTGYLKSSHAEQKEAGMFLKWNFKNFTKTQLKSKQYTLINHLSSYLQSMFKSLEELLEKNASYYY